MILENSISVSSIQIRFTFKELRLTEKAWWFFSFSYIKLSSTILSSPELALILNICVISLLQFIEDNQSVVEKILMED